MNPGSRDKAVQQAAGKKLSSHFPVAFRLGAGAIGALALIAAPSARAADSDALWHIVHDLCVMDMKTNGRPSPCSSVDLAHGYAVMKDYLGATQFLLIPTDRVTGIEDPKVLRTSSPHYWQAAWQARQLFEQSAGGAVPRDEIGLAINSFYGRSQNQLHIHIDCMRPDVLRALKANEGRVGRRWSTGTIALAGHDYRAMRIDGMDLGSRDPFKILAHGDPAAFADMGRETLVVVGSTSSGGKPGFVLLSDRTNPAKLDRAHGEELLDHSCKVLSARRAAGH